MIFYRDEKSLNVERPIQFVRPVKDKDGNIIQNLYISDDCKFYDIDEYNFHDYFGDCPEAYNIPIYYDNRGRAYSSINVEGKKHIFKWLELLK